MESRAAYKKYLYGILSLIFVLIVWKLLSLHFGPLVVPTISSVIHSMITIFTDKSLYKMIFLTIVRLVIGLTIGISLGLIISIFMGRFRTFKELIMPIIGLLQTVPPVSWVVLALVWFGFNGKPAIFIVVISSLPIIALNIYAGIINIDKKLLQMAQVFRFSKSKQFIHIILPSIMPYFNSSFKIALGLGWKIAVMGEVLTTNDGIGGMIKQARINVEPENIIAWSAVIVILFYVSDFILGRLFFRKERQ